MKRFLMISASVVALTAAKPALADPITLAVAGASTAAAAVTAAASGTALTFFGLTGFGAIAAQFAVRAALGYAMNALVGKPGADTSRGYQGVNSLGSSLPHQIIYGETRVGGAVFYQALTSSGSGGNDRLHKFIAFAGHEVESYEAIYLNDEEVTLDANGDVTAPAHYAGHVRIKQYLGTDDQTADADAVSELSDWTTEHRARGIAYLYVRFEDAAEFGTGAPIVTALIRGRKVEDTRTSTTAWSDNPAMCLRDYLLSDFGLGNDAADIDDTLCEAAADKCDELVGSEKRYTCNGAFTLDGAPEDIIRNLLSSMGGIFWNYQGKWAMQAAEYITPTLTLTEDDLRSELQIATRHSRRDNFNTIKGQFKGAETNYQPDDYPRITSGLFLAEDDGVEAVSDLPLLFTDTTIMAQRIARTALRRNRRQVTVTGAFGLRALGARIGDNISLTVDHMGWSEKVFEVVDWRLGMKENDIQVNMILREMDDGVFSGFTSSLQDESGNVLLDESGNELEAIVA